MPSLPAVPAEAAGDGGGSATPLSACLLPRSLPPGPAHCLLPLCCPPVQVYVAYELKSYFQNFRRYVRSYDPARMHDGGDSADPASACQPFSYLGDNDSQPINPCGQIAASFFNDTFAFRVEGPAGGGAAPLAVDDSGIAWSSDADHLYGDVPAVNYNPGGAYAADRGGNTTVLNLNQNQHWMVGGWAGGAQMQPATPGLR